MDWKENDSDAMNFPFTDILSQDLSRTFYAFCVFFFHISKLSEVVIRPLL